MARLTLKILILFCHYSMAQPPPYKANYLKLGAIINVQNQGVTSIGTGLEYGITSNIIVKYKWGHRVLAKSISKPYAFHGIWLNYNRSLYDTYSKLEFAIVSRNLFFTGLATNLIDFDNSRYVGIQPMIGLSFFNISAYYGYNILLYRKGDDMNRNNFGLMYSLLFQRKSENNK